MECNFSYSSGRVEFIVILLISNIEMSLICCGVRV